MRFKMLRGLTAKLKHNGTQSESDKVIQQVDV